MCVCVCVCVCTDVSISGVLVSGAKDNEVRVWSVPHGACLGVGVGHVGSVSAVALSRKQTGRFAVSAGADKLLKVIAFDCAHTHTHTHTEVLSQRLGRVRESA